MPAIIKLVWSCRSLHAFRAEAANPMIIFPAFMIRLGIYMRIMPAEKFAEFGTFSGKFHACLVCNV